MFPYLIPFEFSGETLSVLAQVAAAVAGLLVFSWRRGTGAGLGSAAAFGVGAFAAGLAVVGRLGPFESGPLPLHTYGLLIAMGMMVGIHLAGREAERTGFASSKEMNDLAFHLFVWSLVGARLLFVIVNWNKPGGYGENPAKIFNLMSGGLVFYGGFLGAIAAAWWWAQKRKVPFAALADVWIPVVALGHFFGRMGCIAAGCCWGKECHPGFLLGIEFPEGALAFKEMLRDGALRGYLLEHGHTPALHPTQLYEGVGELVLFVVLLFVRRAKRFHGQALITWLAAYAVLRLTIETFRGDFGRGMLLRWPEADPVLLSTSQVVSVAMILLAAGLWVAWRPKELAEIPKLAAPAAS